MEERHQILEAAIPVTQEQHHPYQIKYSYHCTGQVIGHVENLQEEKGTPTGKNVSYCILFLRHIINGGISHCSKPSSQDIRRAEKGKEKMENEHLQCRT